MTFKLIVVIFENLEQTLLEGCKNVMFHICEIVQAYLPKILSYHVYAILLLVRNLGLIYTLLVLMLLIFRFVQIMKEDDNNWPEPDRVGRQELEIVMGNEHISFTTSKIGSLVDVQSSNDPEGLRIFYYLVQVS